MNLFKSSHNTNCFDCLCKFPKAQIILNDRSIYVKAKTAQVYLKVEQKANNMRDTRK